MPVSSIGDGSCPRSSAVCSDPASPPTSHSRGYRCRDDLGEVVEDVASVAQKVAVRDLHDQPAAPVEHQGHCKPTGDEMRLHDPIQQGEALSRLELPEGLPPL